MKLPFNSFFLIAPLAGLFFFAACKDQNAATEAKNESAVRAILAAMDAGASEEFDRYCAADFQINNPFLPGPAPLQTFKGLMQGQKTGFPDVKHEVVQMFSSGNMVCVRGIYSGTNTGPMQGNPPTGNKVVLPFIFTDEFDAAGKLKTRHVQFDVASFNAQLMGKQ